VSCDFWVEPGGRGAEPGSIVDIGVGRVFVATDLLAAVSEPIELEMKRQPSSDAHGLITRGVVAWIGDQALDATGSAFFRAS